MALLALSVALIALGFHLRGWRRVTREPAARHFGARTAVVVPLLLGIGLAVLGDLAAQRLELSIHLRGFLGVVLLFGPSALLARPHNLGASSAGVAATYDRWPLVLGMWLCTWPLLAGLGILVGWLAQAFGFESLGVASEVAEAASNFDFAVMAFLAVFVVPAVEEIFFRGRLFARLAVRLGPGPANAIQALLFGLGHGWFHFPILMYFGWLLGRARLAGAGMGSLIAAHALQNAVSFALIAAAR